MKRYLVRRIGWVFDDDWYNYDGNHDVDSVYETEAEAISRVNFLNHICFIHMGFQSRPFQVNFEESKKDQFVKRDKLAELVATYLKIDITEIYNPRRGFTWSDQYVYLNKLSTTQITEILDQIGLSFYNHYAIERDKYFLYTFMRNPQIWSKYMDEFDKPKYYYPFYDDRDLDNNFRIANSKIECYYYAINQRHNSITYQLSNETFYKGELNTLTKTPDLLLSILDQCPNVHFDLEKSCLVFAKTITPNELMQIDAVLIDPVLLTEEKPITDSIFKNESRNKLYSKIASKYKINSDINS